MKTLKPILSQYKEKEGRWRKNSGEFHLYFFSFDLHFNLVSSIIALVPNDVELGYVAAKMIDCYRFICHFAVPQKR